MVDEEQKPNEVTIRAEAPPAPAAPVPQVVVLPTHPVPIDTGQRNNGSMDEVKAELQRLHARIDGLITRPEPPKEEPKEEEPVVAVAPPPPPPEPPVENPGDDNPGPRKRGFLEKLLHSGCPS